MDLMKVGSVAPMIDRVLPFESAPEGVAALEERSVIGKLVVRVQAGAGDPAAATP
jgi:alcohol dehydrogenase